MRGKNIFITIFASVFYVSLPCARAEHYECRFGSLHHRVMTFLMQVFIGEIPFQ